MSIVFITKDGRIRTSVCSLAFCLLCAFLWCSDTYQMVLRHATYCCEGGEHMWRFVTHGTDLSCLRSSIISHILLWPLHASPCYSGQPYSFDQTTSSTDQPIPAGTIGCRKIVCESSQRTIESLPRTSGQNSYKVQRRGPPPKQQHPRVAEGRVQTWAQAEAARRDTHLFPQAAVVRNAEKTTISRRLVLFFYLILIATQTPHPTPPKTKDPLRPGRPQPESC